MQASRAYAPVAPFSKYLITHYLTKRTQSHAHTHISRAVPVAKVVIATVLIGHTHTHTLTSGAILVVGSQEDVALRKVVLARKAAVVGVVSIPYLRVVHPEPGATGAHRLQICSTKAWQSLQCTDEAGHTHVHTRRGQTGFRSVQQRHCRAGMKLGTNTYIHTRGGTGFRPTQQRHCRAEIELDTHTHVRTHPCRHTGFRSA
jgi:hypothetical protein